MFAWFIVKSLDLCCVCVLLFAYTAMQLLNHTALPPLSQWNIVLEEVLVFLFAVEESVPSPACGWAFIGEVTLMSMQALFYQLTSLHQVVP